MVLSCAARRSCPNCILLGFLTTLLSALGSEPVHIESTFRQYGMQSRIYPVAKAFTIIKIRSAASPPTAQLSSQNFGRIMLEKYSSQQLDQARCAPSTSRRGHEPIVKLLHDHVRRHETRRPFEPCKLSTCPLCKREHPRTSTRLKLPFHLFSP